MTIGGALDPIRGAFRAVTVACVPAAEALDADGWRRVEAIANGALADRPASVRRQVVLFARVLGVLSALRYGRRLERIGPQRLRVLLGALERAPVLLLRRGTWGLRTLAFMGYYSQAEVQASLGYGAVPQGWAGRGGKQGPWPKRGGAAAESFVLTVDDVEPGDPDAAEVLRD